MPRYRPRINQRFCVTADHATFQAPSEGQAKALYDYSRQTDEELSFPEDATLDVYDTTDPEWTLVALNGEYGFAPANYIELSEAAPVMPSRPRIDTQAEAQSESGPTQSPMHRETPMARLGQIMQQRTGPSTAGAGQTAPQQFTPEASDEEQPTPSLPQRRQSAPMPPPIPQATPRSPDPEPEPEGVMASPNAGYSDHEAVSPSGYHLYNIHEMISHMGKNKKMPTTLGINVNKGIVMIAPEKSRDGPQKEWTAEKLTHYSMEGKHVFIELVKPSKSIDFHAGAKDTAQEIVSALGELAGAVRAAGLTEVLAAGRGPQAQKTGHMRFEFMAQGDDEVTVAENDEVVVLDDTKSEEWWMVRRLRNGNEGVVPSSYVEITGVIEPPRTSSAIKSGMSTVERNRREEERVTKEAVMSNGDGKSKRETRQERDASSSKSKPNLSRIRVWTDRSGSFKVEAEFLGLKDGKIHLHKMNGVKIAVAVSKMSVEDLEYVERATNQSLDDEKPLSDIKRRNTQRQAPGRSPQVGAAVEPSKPKYDWFDFFLQSGVNPQICQKYTNAFERDQMGEENLQDIEPTLLRTLGLKEGDILRVMKFLDEKFGRSREQRQAAAADSGGDGLFSGPGGTLRNNTRKGRPAPAVETNDTVDPRAFEQASLKKENASNGTPEPSELKLTRPRRVASGFDDDAWDVKPSKQQPPARASPPPTQQPPVASLQKPAPTGALAELSLLSPPLQPTQAQPTRPQAPPQLPIQQYVQPPSLLQQPVQSQPTGADRSFFDQISQQQQKQQALSNQLPNQPQQISMPRQRPQAPPQQTSQSSFLPLPPGRPASAPQNQQPSAFGPPPLQPQMTGQPPLAPPGQSLTNLNQQRLQQQFAHQQPPMQPQPTGLLFGQQPTGLSAQNQFAPTIQSQRTGPPPQPSSLYPQQQTSFYPQQPQALQPQNQQQFLMGQQTGSPFADPPRPPYQPMQSQPTGFPQPSQHQPAGFSQQSQPQQSAFPQQPQPQPSALQQSTFNPPPPQIPQQTGVNNFLPQPLRPQQTGTILNGFGGVGPQPPGFAQQTSPPPQLPALGQPQPQPPPVLQPQQTGPAPSVRFGNSGAPKLTPQPTGKANLANASESLRLLSRLS